MRLTLRTLLGYLDDILEPQQTKTLGEKISESSVAAALVARIREVVRRRRISAPEVIGPGSDPDSNVVAEYLDNTLPPEKVEDLERLCLESDVHLAEVASCHQILTMVLGDPVDVAQSTRERMYALGSVSGGDTARPAAVAAAPVPPVSSTAPVPRPEIPEYLTRGTAWRRILPAAAGLLIVGIWLGLIFSDPTQSWRIWERSPPSATPVAATPAPPADGAPAAPPVQAQEPTAEAPAVAAAEAVVPAAAAPATGNLTTPPLPPVEGATVAADAASAAAMPAPVVVAANASTPGAAADGVPPPTSPAEGAAAPVAVAAAPEAKLMYNDTNGVMLRLEGMESWMLLPRRTLLLPGDQLACPEPFTASIQMLNGDVEVMLAGGTRMTVQSGDVAPVVLQLDRGRAVFRRSASAPLPNGTPIAVQVEDRRFTLELLSAGAEVGLEVMRQISTAPSERPQSLSFDGGLFLTAGSARLSPSEGEPFTLDAQASFVRIADGRMVSPAQPLLAPPEWMLPALGGAAVVAQQIAHQFEESFQLGTPLDATIPALMDNRHSRLSELATRTLALIDDYRGLVRALSAAHQESRLAAFTGLGAWIRRDPGHAQLLSDELSRSYNDETSLKLIRLVWGFAPQDARNPTVSQELVDWLGDAEVAVREGAYFQIQRLVGGQPTFRYHPDASESQRASSVKSWNNHLRKTGALLEPGPTPVDEPPAGEAPVN